MLAQYLFLELQGKLSVSPALGTKLLMLFHYCSQLN